MLSKQNWQQVLDSEEAKAIRNAARKAYSRRRQKNSDEAPWSIGVLVQDLDELAQPIQKPFLDRTWSNCTQPLRDCDYTPNYQHVQTFLDVIFPLQWGFFALNRHPSRKWLFDTIVASEPMYYASLGLCVSFETGLKAGYTNGHCEVTPEVRTSRLLAMRGLQPCIDEMKQGSLERSFLPKSINAIAIILLLSSLEIYGETEGVWEVHINAVGIFLDLIESQIGTSDSDDREVGFIGQLLESSASSFATRALEFFVTTYVWTDILAEAAHGTITRHYREHQKVSFGN